MQAGVEKDELLPWIRSRTRGDRGIHKRPNRHTALDGQPQQQTELLSRVVVGDNQYGIMPAAAKPFPQTLELGERELCRVGNTIQTRAVLVET